LKTSSKEKLLSRVAKEVSVCRKCRLWKTAKNGVPGEGAPDSPVLLVGEAPGNQEDLTGRPFVGSAGKLLEKLLRDIGCDRNQVFISNIVKHRPPRNREPRSDEVEACTPYLERQIKIIKPEIILAMGRHATKHLLAKTGCNFGMMSEVRGRVYSARLFNRRVKIIPTYHPAAALYMPKYTRVLAEDFRRMKAELEHQRV
jgi:DNA polymerase